MGAIRGGRKGLGLACGIGLARPFCHAGELGEIVILIVETRPAHGGIRHCCVVIAGDESGEPFGMSRLEALLQVNRARALDQLLAEIGSAVHTHRGPLEAADDATMVALRFAQPGAAGRA